MTMENRDIDNPPLLEIRDVSVQLGNEMILDRVSLDVAPGSIHALVGPNGAGKTTLIRSIMGGMPHKGAIRLRIGNNQHIGYVPQLLDFDRSLPITVGDFFLLMLDKRPAFIGAGGKKREEIRGALSKTGCDHLMNRKIGGLSGGELRRVLLAQALTPLPQFLLLDEPSSSVDEYGARMFEKMLTSLRDEHQLTVLMVTHDISMIIRMADVATGLNRKITFNGDPAKLRDSDHLARIFDASAVNEERAQ